MTHLDEERLADLALGGPALLDTDEEAHIDACAACRSELAELRQVVATGGSLVGDDQPVSPPPVVWERIQAELGKPSDEPSVVAAAPSPSPAPEAKRLTLPKVRRWHAAAAAVVVGAVLGVVGANLADDDPSRSRPGPTDQGELVARSTLLPLPGKQGAGDAQLRRLDGRLKLTVRLDGVSAGAGDLELWLINTDGKRLRSLGFVEPGGALSVDVPGWLINNGYRVVDVSQEPHDGDPAHSGDSEVRGRLRL